MSLIGTLEQFALSSVLQRIEVHEKSGLFVVKQEAQWVELYFHQGQLMCIGPIRTNATLGERLFLAGIISQQALQETLATLSAEQQQSEACIARTLIDLKHIGRDKLRAWAIERASEVIQPLLLWSRGEIYFDENAALPADRLLVAITVTSLLPARTALSALPASPQTPEVAPDTATNAARAATAEQSSRGIEVAPDTATNAARALLLPSDNDAFASSSAQSLGAQAATAEQPGRGIEVPSGQPASSTDAPVSSNATGAAEQPAPTAHPTDIARVPTLYETGQFSPENASITPLLHSTDSFLAAVKAAGSTKIPVFSPSASSAPSSLSEERQTSTAAVLDVQEMSRAPSTPGSFSAILDGEIPSTAFSMLFDEQEAQQAVQSAQPRPLLSVATARIDTSLLPPEMVLVAADMSALLTQNSDIEITPEEWRLLTRVDGQTTLGKACQDLLMPPKQARQLAGELQALGLVQVGPPTMLATSEDAARAYHAPLSSESIVPMTPPLTGPQPASDVLSPFTAGRERSAPQPSLQSSGRLTAPFGKFVPLLGT